MIDGVTDVLKLFEVSGNSLGLRNKQFLNIALELLESGAHVLTDDVVDFNLIEDIVIHRLSFIRHLLHLDLTLGLEHELVSTAEELTKRLAADLDLVEDVVQSLSISSLNCGLTLIIELKDSIDGGGSHNVDILEGLCEEILNVVFKLFPTLLDILDLGLKSLEDSANVIEKLVGELGFVLPDLTHRLEKGLDLAVRHIALDESLSREIDNSSIALLGSGVGRDEGKSESSHGGIDCGEKNNYSVPIIKSN